MLTRGLSPCSQGVCPPVLRNIAAGYMCKKNLIPWSLARKKFDEYQNRNSAPGNWKPEGMSTQLAERYGYDYKVNPIEQLNHVGYTIGSLIIRKIRGKW